MSERDFDVVVFGATGVTGRRVAAYLADRSARDTAKLERVLGEDGVEVPEPIRADVGDPASLAAMARRTRAVVNLAGPYTLNGRPVIEACVEAGTHYADITGEIPFVRQIVDAFHEQAQDAGLKIVQACGFEALPFDLAVLLATETARDRYGENLAEADLEASVKPPPGRPRFSDGLSGGTFQSMAVAATIDDAQLADPAALVTDAPMADLVRRRSPIEVRPRRGSHGAVIAPMTPAAFITPAVIHRTYQLLGISVGVEPAPIRYREGLALRGGPAPLRYAMAAGLAANQAAARGITRRSPAVRKRFSRALASVLPSSGFGPDTDRMESWHWGISLTARTDGDHEVRVEVDADGHPAYLATARWLGETGLLLAEDGATPDRAGCLTPATALGTGSLERLEHAQVRFSVVPPR